MEMTTPECGICFACEFLHRTVMHDTERRINKNACKHTFCVVCLETWIGDCINSGRRLIICPHPECKSQLFGDDIARIAPIHLAAYQELVGINHKERIKALPDDIVRLLKYGCFRKCPACSLLIEHISGCDSMLCLCGQSFCYTCGYSLCGCAYIQMRQSAHAPFTCIACAFVNEEEGFHCKKCNTLRPYELAIKPEKSIHSGETLV